MPRRRRAGLGHLAVAAPHLCRQGPARCRRGSRHRRGLRRRPQEARLPAVGHRSGLCRHRRHLHRPDRNPRAGADLGLSRRRLRRGHHRPAGQSAGRAVRRPADRRQRIDRHGGPRPGLGAGGVVLGADCDPAVGSGVAMNASRDLPRLGAVIAIGVLGFLPMARLPAFYDSFLYLVFFWVSLSTSWALLSGFAGYFSLGHAAFFGVGVYVTADLTTKFGWTFLATLPVAAVLPALLALGIGAIVFRLRRLRGELFALLTLSVTFVIATIILNTPIDGGGGIFMSAVPLPNLMPTPTGTIYLLGFILCVASLGLAWTVVHSRLGLGLFAIHDDEDVAEAKGVPTLRYKLIAFALSAAIAGAVGGVHAMYVGFITTSGTFELTVPLYVVLMSVLGGARSWFGPAIGATTITVLLYAFISGGEAMVGRAIVGVILISAILWLPDGFVPATRKWLAKHRRVPPRPATAEVAPVVPAAKPVGDAVLLRVRG